MQTSLKAKLLAIFLLLFVTVAQGYAVHLSHTVYEPLSPHNNYANLLMVDYLRYCP